MAKTYTDWPDKAKHSISYAQHKKNIGGGKPPTTAGGAAPNADRVNARARKDPAFLTRALKNPGLRARLATDLLPRSMQQERGLQTRLNAPIVPGSTVTGRDLAHRAREAATVEYSPLEQELGAQTKTAVQGRADVAQQYGQAEANIGGWYDQYLAQIAGATQRVGAAQDAAVAGAQSLGQGITGLGLQQAGQLQQAAQAQAAPGQAPAADIAQGVAQAQTARENLTASYLGQAQQQAASTKGLTEFVGGVVAPGQKVQALTTAEQAKQKALTTAQSTIDKLRDKAVTLAREKGAYTQKQRADIRQQEVANVVALGQLANQKATAAASTPAAKAKAAGTQASLDVDKQNATKAGVSLKTWQAMTPAQQAKVSAAANPKDPNKLDVAITDPNSPFVGKTPRQVAALPTSQRESAIKRAYKLTHPGRAGAGAGGAGGKGPDWAPQGQMGSALTQVTQLKELARRAKTGLKFDPTGKEKRPGAPLDRRAAGQKILGFATKLKDPILATAALDAVYDGHLSAATVRGLIAAKYQPARVARALGVPTAGQNRPTTATTYGGGAGAGSGST